MKILSPFPFPASLRTLASLGLLFAAAGSAAAQTYLFDFGGGAQTTRGADPLNDPVNTWNNITGAIGTVNGGQLTGAISTEDAVSGINLVILSRFNAVNENGAKETASVYPDNATVDSLYGNTEVWNSLTNIFPSFKLTGLNPNTSHHITFYASRNGVSDNRDTDYTVAGLETTTVTLNAANNTNNTVTAELVKPSAAGEITISLAPGANNNNAYHFTYLGVLKVQVVPPQQLPIVFSDEPDDVTVAVGRPVTFTAAVNSTPPYLIQWQKDGQDIQDATNFSYTIPAVSLDMDNSRYSVTVSNLGYTGVSREAVLRVNPDNTPPAVTTSSSTGPYRITLVFSEEMDETSVEDTTRYTLDNGDNFIVSAELKNDRKTVVLTPGLPMAATAGLLLGDVQDLALNAVAANTLISLTVPQPDGLSLLFDFGGGDATSQSGGANDDPLNAWNNISGTQAGGDGNSLSGFIRNNGEVSDMTLTIVQRFNGVNATGTLQSPVFPPDATRDSLYGNTAEFNLLSNIFPVMRLGGLNPLEEHDLAFFASRDDAANENRTTRYTVTGATESFAELDASNNQSRLAVVTGIKPNSNGEITIALTAAESNNTANKFTYLGVMRVTPRPAAGALPVLLPPVVSNGNLTLTWTGSGTLEWSATMTTGSWTAITPAPASPYSEAIVPGQKKFFRLRP